MLTPESSPPVLPIDLTAQQIVYDHVWNLITQQLTGQPLRPHDPAFDLLGKLPVTGAFVTLKRQGRLRGCCGALGEALPLSAALAQAARRTVIDDPRLPPVSPTELPHLTMEITVLGGFEVVEGSPTQRVAEVIVGQHGLRVECDGRAGLLLPQVATERGWTAEEFLAQVCQKAGLQSDAWTWPQARLLRFGGRIIDGPTPSSELQQLVGTLPSRFTADDHRRLLEHCQRNIVALLTGATPDYFAGRCPDGDLHGLVLSVIHPESMRATHLSRVSLRPTMPLQSTLFRLLEEAARWISQQGWRGQMMLQLALLDDPSMHGTLAEPDLRGLDIGRRCTVARLEGRQAIFRNMELDAAGHLERLRELIPGGQRDQTMLLSFRVQNGDLPLDCNTLPSAQPRQQVRRPAVAGKFYPDEPAAERAAVAELLKDGMTERRRVPAVMLPHAGWVYSGRIAGDVLRRIEVPRSALVIGPKHTNLGVEWAVSPAARWELPGGDVQGDMELAERLVRSIHGWQFDEAAHQREHGIEVELPLLRHLNPNVRVVGVALASADWTTCESFATQLADVLRGMSERPLLVISSDMHHFGDDATNRKLDQLALEAVATCRPQHLLETVREHGITMCGVVPAVIVLEALRQLGTLHQTELVAYGTSADVNGDRSRVVGYAGMIVT
ncbi:MAG: AmmeMemoRadiSam system protein B [Pirellulales bacterium]